MFTLTNTKPGFHAPVGLWAGVEITHIHTYNYCVNMCGEQR